jgi:hypothetical protein
MDIERVKKQKPLGFDAPKVIYNPKHLTDVDKERVIRMEIEYLERMLPEYRFQKRLMISQNNYSETYRLTFTLNVQ